MIGKQIELKIVSFELAVKLKELGFDLMTQKYWSKPILEPILNNGVTAYKCSNEARRRFHYSAPTLELVRLWSLKIHKIHILYEYAGDRKFAMKPMNMKDFFIYQFESYSDDYEIALDQIFVKLCDEFLKYKK